MNRRAFLLGAGAVATLGLSGCGLFGPNAPRASKEELLAFAREASREYQVPFAWIEAVMWQESRFRTHDRHGRPIMSHAGAIGPMQVMPATFAEIKRSHPEIGSNIYNPRTNVFAGTIYLRRMYELYGAPGFLAAYNAGPGRLNQFYSDDRQLPPETRNYVRVVANRIWGDRAPRLQEPVWYASLDRAGQRQPALAVRRHVGSTMLARAPSSPVPPVRPGRNPTATASSDPLGLRQLLSFITRS